MNKLGPNVTHKSRWKLIVMGILPDRICLFKSLLDWDVRANGLIFRKKTTKVGLHNMWCRGAENKRDPPGLFNGVLQSHTVITLAYH